MKAVVFTTYGPPDVLRITEVGTPTPKPNEVLIRVHAAAVTFLANHAEAAAGMGWTTPELFGVHPVVGVRRVDCCGALMLSNGSLIAEMRPDLILYANGLAYLRRPPGGPSVPVWQVAPEQ